MIAGHDTEGAEHLDPKRWITLAIILTAVVIAALDTTVLNVAIPTMLREFDTTLPSLQWVITGYSLTFAALLIIGGRLGDIFGARRMFIVGAALFSIGSFLASIANSVVVLVIGEAVIEGMGASLMLPATMGILSSTFTGRERATAFAAWGAVIGAAVAFGPLIGGFLTTNYSWRWAFRINVIVAPLAIVGAMLFMPRSKLSGRRERIDVPGALLVASGMFLLVFAISEGGVYGWFTPRKLFEIAGLTLWPASAPISIVPVAFLGSMVLLYAFYRVQRSKERAALDPLFEFSNLSRPGFRYGTFTLLLMATGQVAFLLVLSVVLQDGQHLSAVDTGLWLVPSGLFIILGSQVGSRLTRTIGTTTVVRVGLLFEGLGLAVTAIALSPDITIWQLLPGFALVGTGIGFASSQLNNVILSDVPADRAGAASGANSTVRMIGAAFGIAVSSSLLSSQTIRHAVDNLTAAAGLPPDVQARAVEQVRTSGVSFGPIPGLTDSQSSTIASAVEHAVVSGAKAPLVFSAAIVLLASALSLLIPQVDGGRVADVGEDPAELARQQSEAMGESVAVQ